MEIVCVLHTSFLYNCQVSFLYFTGYWINNLQLQAEQRKTCGIIWQQHWIPEKVIAQLSDFTFTFHFHALEKEMATHSSVLAWRIPGTGEPGGLPSMGSHRVGHDWSDLAAAAYTKVVFLKLLSSCFSSVQEPKMGYHFLYQKTEEFYMRTWW